MTNVTAESGRYNENPATPAHMTQKVVIINGNAEILEQLETVLDAGHYDVVFVESTTHAYSQIRRVQPDLAILCLTVDDAEGLRVLSMLKLDAETRDIPVLTYTTEQETEVSEAEAAEPAELELPTAKPAVWMN
ncbi:MAG TPA: response regulator [Vicinamibacterales bacterium]|jgi:PleD family two-component response regulator